VTALDVEQSGWVPLAPAYPVFIETSARCRKDLTQYFRVEEESRPGVEFKAASLHGGGAAADDVAPLHDADIDA
jgi:hypothetical protein